MISWVEISKFKEPKYTDPDYGDVYLLCKDCGEGTVQSVSVGWYNLQVNGWCFADSNSSYTIRERGYRVTHFSKVENYPELVSES